MKSPNKENQPARSGKRLYWTGRSLFRGLFKTYFRWHVFNAGRVPPTGPVILVANHQSFIDPGAVGAAVSREVYFLARESAFRFPGVGGLLRRVNAIPVNIEGGAMAGLRAGLEVLQAGNALMIFPEGARTPDGEMHDFQSGVGLMVAKSGAPVVPVRIFGLYDAYGRHLNLPRPRRVWIKFGRPLHFDQFVRESGVGAKAAYQAISQEIHAAVASLKPDLEP